MENDIDRTLTAYILMGVMLLALFALVAWRIYYSRDRVQRRVRTRELEIHRTKMSDRADGLT